MQPRKEHYRRKLPHYQQPGQWYSITFTLVGAMPKGAMNKYSIQLETARTRLEELRSRESDNPLSDTSHFGSPDTSHFGDLGIGDLGKSPSLAQAKKEYQIALRKHRLAYDKILNKSVLPGINLLKKENREIIEEALMFWEGKRLTNHAWCIMSNHVHWIITVFEKGAEVSNSDTRETDNPLSGNLRVGNSQSLFSTWESRSPERIQKPVYLQDILHSVKLFTARRINENEKRTGQLWEHESFDTTIRNDRHFVNVFNYVVQNPVSAGLIANCHDWSGTRTFQSP